MPPILKTPEAGLIMLNILRRSHGVLFLGFVLSKYEIIYSIHGWFVKVLFI